MALFFGLGAFVKLFYGSPITNALRFPC
jgi:hypothetical protein